MGRRKKQLPFLENVEITDAGAEGKAVARVNDRVLFVPFAAPGDVVDVQVYKKRRNYYEGRIVALKKPSPLRVEPACSHFGLCGGCKWQHLDYEQQKYFKTKQVKESLDRIAKVDYPEIEPIIGSEKTLFYRNKLEFTFSDRRWLTDADLSKEEGGPEDTRGLGFHLPGMFDKILDIETCYLQPDPSNEIRRFIKQFSIEHHFTFWNSRNQYGFLRNLIIRNASSGDLMVVVVFGEDKEPQRELLLCAVADAFPQITSLQYVINTKPNDSIYDLDVCLWKGKGYNLEIMPSALPEHEALRFKVGPKSFYQTNPEQAFKLYRTAFEFAGFTGKERVYDLYTGTGTIALFIAHAVKKVVGIESVEEAVEAARKNAEENRMDNVTFYSGDMAKILDKAFVTRNGEPDVIVTDPPRAGMHPKVIQRILEMQPSKIVYVSCNPATQARDIALLDERYRINRVRPVDMFPQTHHVENVVLLTLK